MEKSLLERVATEQFLVEKYCRLEPEFSFGPADDSYAVEAARVVISALERELTQCGFSDSDASRYAPVFANMMEDRRVQHALYQAGHDVPDEERVLPETPRNHGIDIDDGLFEQLYDAYVGIWSRCRLQDPLYEPFISEMHVKLECDRGEQFAEYSVIGALHLLSGG